MKRLRISSKILLLKHKLRISESVGGSDLMVSNCQILLPSEFVEFTHYSESAPYKPDWLPMENKSNYIQTIRCPAQPHPPKSPVRLLHQISPCYT